MFNKLAMLKRALDCTLFHLSELLSSLHTPTIVAILSQSCKAIAGSVFRIRHDMVRGSSKLAPQSAEQASMELASVSELVQSQVDAGMPHDEVVEALYSSWADRLSGMSVCSPNEKIKLTSALSCGPWSEHQRKELARAILTGSQDSAPKRKRPNQKCPHFENFIREEMWGRLKDMGFSQITRCSFVAGSAYAIGIECPDQPTLYRMVSVLAYCEKNYDMSQEEVHKLMDKIQCFIKGYNRAFDLQYLEQYPCIAQDLPDTIKKNAFERDPGLPVEVDIPELDVILGDNKMRGRKRDAGPDWLQHVPEAFRAGVLDQLMSSKRGRPSALPMLPTAKPLPSADLLRVAHTAPTLKVEVKAGGDEAPTPAAHDTAQTEGGGAAEPKEQAAPEAKASHGDPSIEELEASLLAGMDGKKKKTGSAATKKEVIDKVVMKKPAGNVAKKPAAATGMRPDGASIDLSSVFNAVRARKATLDRKRCGSMAYHRTVTLATQAGFSDTEAKVLARDASQKACKLIFG